MRLILFLFIVIAFLLPEFSHAKEWRLAVCYGKHATQVDKKFRKNISDTAARTFGAVDEQSKFAFMARACEKEPDLACYGDTSAIYCREEPLALISRISAWLAAEAAFIYLSHNGDKELLNQKPELSWVDTLLLADAESYDGDEAFIRRGQSILKKRNLSAESLHAIYSLVTDLYFHTNNDVKPDSKNEVLMFALKIYQMINEYAFSFLLGHEGYHFNNNVCPITKKSKLEINGVWQEIYKLQQKNGLFDSKVKLDKHELTADLCGYKWMTAISQKHDNGEPILMALSKRTAIDLLATPILTGALNSFAINHLGQDAPKVKVVDGYLYPQSRLILASATLRQTEKTFPKVVKICNDTAKAIVTMVQHSYHSYPKSSGNVPDSLLAELPPGVEKSWKGKPWSDESYLCQIGDDK